MAAALPRLTQLASHVSSAFHSSPHPFDPLSATEIEAAVSIVRESIGNEYHFNAVTLREPKKADMLDWLSVDGKGVTKPNRIAEIVALGRGSKTYDGLVDMTEGKVVKWELTEGVQPLVSIDSEVSRPSNIVLGLSLACVITANLL